MTLLKKFAIASASTIGFAGGALAIERNPSAIDPNSAIGQATSGIIAIVRFTRSLHTAAHIMIDYRMLFARYDEYESDIYKNDRSQVHARSAQRCLNLARKQGAVYVKIGQHVASMKHVVPPEYHTTLKALEDKAAYRPFHQIEKTISRELGENLWTTFNEFHETPVAAASLAQVHKAKLRNTGQIVAVKVQYPGLESLVKSDLTSIRMLSWMMAWVFPFFNMDWVVDQFRKNLQKELDFHLEAKSAMKTASFFDNDSRIFVPHIHAQHSTPRLLTMEYVEGFRVDDIDQLQKAGIDKHQVSRAVVEAFAQMIFINGFVHCDPHAGNLMVRPGKSGNFQLFLLDHGLYRELDDDFRKSYCNLWKGMVLRRTNTVEQACEQLGAPGFANIFSVFLLNRSWNNVKKIGTDIRMSMSKEEIKQLRSDFRQGGLKSQEDISDFVERVPDDLLLVFKMNSLVRNVNKALGASVNRFKTNARYAVRGLRWSNKENNHEGFDISFRMFENHPTLVASTIIESFRVSAKETIQTLVNWFETGWDIICVETQLLAIDIAFMIIHIWNGGNFNSISRLWNSIDTGTKGMIG